MQDLFTLVNISDTLQILKECDFYNKIKIFTLLHFWGENSLVLPMTLENEF